ncbi:unnamed protein product [Cuscuta epithymum]|uniref:Uncharacterized protein n=1 Tax=Cuscuta epithymum TaxID=186058 RepID=A0AAV0DPQ8_9ASTE|nr:unnamed protein product [Cuscuta epithymum]
MPSPIYNMHCTYSYVSTNGHHLLTFSHYFSTTHNQTTYNHYTPQTQTQIDMKRTPARTPPTRLCHLCSDDLAPRSLLPARIRTRSNDGSRRRCRAAGRRHPWIGTMEEPTDQDGGGSRRRSSCDEKTWGGVGRASKRLVALVAADRASVKCGGTERWAAALDSG